MGMLDHLIDKETNKEPKVGMEYIYYLDIGWTAEVFDEFKIKKGSIVTNVVKRTNGGYDFILKETGVLYSCNYGWAFLENTPENIVKIKNFEEKNNELQLLKKQVEILRKNIDQLK